MERHRKRVTFTLIAATLATLFLLIVDLSAVDRLYSDTASNASNYYRDNTNRQIGESCDRLPAIEARKCAEQTKDTAREYQRREQDLAAQKTMALWTKIMGIAALIGMSLSAIGVWLVYTTFRATREANDIAKDTAYRQLRAYLAPGGATLEYWLSDKLIAADMLNFTVLATVENSGLTPALLTDERSIVKTAGGSVGFETRRMTQIVAPRASKHAQTAGGVNSGPKATGDRVFLEAGFLFTYTDYLGKPWTEVIWWRSDALHPARRKKTTKLILSEHKSGSDKNLRWSEDEWAEIEARAATIKGQQP